MNAIHLRYLSVSISHAFALARPRQYVRLLSVVLVCVGLSAPILRGSETDSETIRIPKVTGIVVDGALDDWKDLGFKVTIFGDRQRAQPAASDFDAELRLAWDDHGLLIMLDIHDDALVSRDSIPDLWVGDSAAFYLQGSSGVQFGFTTAAGFQLPGSTEIVVAEHPISESPGRPNVDVARRLSENHYTMELRIPLERLGVAMEDGATLRLGVRLTDVDEADPVDRYNPLRRTQLYWLPTVLPSVWTNVDHRLVLSDTASDAHSAIASASLESLRWIIVQITGSPDCIGKAYSILSNGEPVYQGTFIEHQGRGSDSARVHRSAIVSDDDLQIVIDDAVIGRASVPDIKRVVQETLFRANLRFEPFVFSDSQFPKPLFEDSLLIEEAIGPYTLKTTYYDSNYHVVERAETVGRYGAVVDVIPMAGPVFRRYATLMKVAAEAGWTDFTIGSAMRLPAEWGISSAVVDQFSSTIQDAVTFAWLDETDGKPWTAILLAALWEADASRDTPAVIADPLAQDKQWWVTYKSKFEWKTEPVTVTRPMTVDLSRPELRAGSDVEAGMRPGSADRIDAHLQAWADASGEPFSVCLARNGIIFLHKAYGSIDDRPMDVSDARWIYSLSKMIGASALMILVDAGLVNLDDPISKFFPELNLPVTEPQIRVRHLMTHTAGMTGHDGHGWSDLEHRLAAYISHLKPETQFEYDGTGNEIVGCIIERITGLSIQNFMYRHLLEPLGMNGTTRVNMSWSTRSTAEDLVRLGQMLLNRGTYGNKQFFNESTFEQMLPRSLNDVFGMDSDLRVGIGLFYESEWGMPYRSPGFGVGTFGHGSASNTVLRIDPVNNLVVAVARSAIGERFHDYYFPLVDLIIDSLER